MTKDSTGLMFTNFHLIIADCKYMYRYDHLRSGLSWSKYFSCGVSVVLSHKLDMVAVESPSLLHLFVYLSFRFVGKYLWYSNIFDFVTTSCVYFFDFAILP